MRQAAYIQLLNPMIANHRFCSDPKATRRWFRELYHLCYVFVILVALSFHPGCRSGYSFCVCEASTVAAKYAASDSIHRDEQRRRSQSGVQITNDFTFEKDNGSDYSDDEISEEPIGLAGYRNDYAGGNDTLVHQKALKHGFGHLFAFQRFQSPKSIRKALDSVRSVSSFKWFEGKDGRKGYVSCTKLGGDYVLAESEQIAKECRAEDVLRVYLSGKLQARWNAKDCLDCRITKFKNQNGTRSSLINSSLERAKKIGGLKFLSGISGNQGQSNTNVARENTYFYLQDLLLKSQRVIREKTGPMRYQQIIEIDKVGQNNYSVLVRLFKNKSDNSSKATSHDRFDEQIDLNNAMTTTVKKPFESLEVYVGLEQMGNDVKIYAAGVFEVNRNVVPKIIVFDTSGFAGSLAGKGTLWLAAYFEKAAIKRKQLNTKFK